MLDAIKNRFSPREYLSKEVESEKINEIIEAGLRAPSGKNLQDGIILAITNKEIISNLSKINAQVMGAKEGYDPFYGAPCVLVVLNKKTHLAELDGAAIIENILLEVVNQGLASRWINRAKEEFETEYGKELLKSLGLDPEEYVGIGNVVIGYSNAENPHHPIKENRVYYIK